MQEIARHRTHAHVTPATRSASNINVNRSAQEVAHLEIVLHLSNVHVELDTRRLTISVNQSAHGKFAAQCSFRLKSLNIKKKKTFHLHYI